MRDDDNVVIVGGGLAGWHTAHELRANGFCGHLTMLSEENQLPYDRPPLSKHLLRVGADSVPESLATSDDIEATLDLRRGAKVTGLKKHSVTTDYGAEIYYDALVIATGARARDLPPLTGHPRAHVLRSFGDAMKLRNAMETARSVLVVGAGFIGAEVATAARDRGLDVTIVEAQAVPYEATLGGLVGGITRQIAESYGVSLITGRTIRSVDEDSDAVTVVLSDGSSLTTDLAIVGIGSQANTDWLEATVAQRWQRGVVCDAVGRVRGLEDAYGPIFALGDVAAWYDEVQGRPVRFEHWTTAVEQAPIVARALLGELTGGSGAEQAGPLLPYFWSDQFGRKLQLLGRPGIADRVEILEGEPAQPRAKLTSVPSKLIVGYFADDALVAVVGISAPARLMRYRSLVQGGASRRDTLAFTRTTAAR